MLIRNMFWMGLLCPVLAGFILPGNTGRSNEIKKWVVSESSNLQVNGSTNVNKFSCDILSYGQTDTLIVSKSNRGITLVGNISLSVQSFDCHNTIMTHDLRKTLNEKQYPKLHIIFLSLSKLPELTSKPELINGLVNIEIAGVRKRYEIDYQITADAEKITHLVGTHDVNFSDFNLVPPRKLGGMIQTKDKLSVQFHLKMKQLD